MIDQLISDISNVSSDPVVKKLVSYIKAWKKDNSSVADLEKSVERYIGNTWIESEIEHNQIYSLWSKFKDNEIRHINGMTMNERLFAFGLFERFDEANSKESKLKVYAKLHAQP